MNTTTILSVTFVALFVLSYLGKRRYGLLGLGLIAGSFISINWASYITILLQSRGLSLLNPPLGVVVGICVVLLPALILMIVAPKYKKMYSRVIGSLLFALLGVTLIIAEFYRSAQNALEPNGTLVYINQYQAIIIVVAIIAALIDVFHTHLPKKKLKSSSH